MAISQWQKAEGQASCISEKISKMSIFENEKKSQGFQAICGIDEVGRGPLAGPVVAAVILNDEHEILGLNDSKQLSAHKREELVKEIKKNARAIGIGEATAEEIDQLNIYQATKVAMQKTIDQLQITPDCLLIDAMVLDNGFSRRKSSKAMPDRFRLRLPVSSRRSIVMSGWLNTAKAIRLMVLLKMLDVELENIYKQLKNKVFYRYIAKHLHN